MYNMMSFAFAVKGPEYSRNHQKMAVMQPQPHHRAKQESCIREASTLAWHLCTCAHFTLKLKHCSLQTELESPTFVSNFVGISLRNFKGNFELIHFETIENEL
jgi:hypothetical protein